MGRKERRAQKQFDHKIKAALGELLLTPEEVLVVQHLVEIHNTQRCSTMWKDLNGRWQHLDTILLNEVRGKLTKVALFLRGACHE